MNLLSRMLPFRMKYWKSKFLLSQRLRTVRGASLQNLLASPTLGMVQEAFAIAMGLTSAGVAV